MAHQVIFNSVYEQDIKEQEAIINSKTAAFNSSAATIRELLATVEKETVELALIAPSGSGDFRIREMQYALAAQKFAALMSELTNLQKTANDRHQSQVQRQYRLINPLATQEELDKVAEAVGAMTLTTTQMFAVGQTDDPLGALQRMKARRKDAMDIEKGIYTLQQLALELQESIEKSQGVINRLEFYMENAITYTEKAEDLMGEAVQSQKNIRRIKCCCCSCC